MNERKNEDSFRLLSDEYLAEVTGGVGPKRPKYVSSFYCEKCNKTIRLNGVYVLENARSLHDRKEHPLGK